MRHFLRHGWRVLIALLFRVTWIQGKRNNGYDAIIFGNHRNIGYFYGTLRERNKWLATQGFYV